MTPLNVTKQLILSHLKTTTNLWEKDLLWRNKALMHGSWKKLTRIPKRIWNEESNLD